MKRLLKWFAWRNWVFYSTQNPAYPISITPHVLALLLLAAAIIPVTVLAASPTDYPYPYMQASPGTYSYSFSLGSGASVPRSYPKADIRNGEVTGINAVFGAPLIINTNGKIDDGSSTFVSEDHILTIPELKVYTGWHHTFSALCTLVCPSPGLGFSFQPFLGHSAGGSQFVQPSQTFNRANPGAYQPVELSPPGANQSLSGTITVSAPSVTKGTFTTYSGTANGTDSVAYSLRQWTAEDVLSTRIKHSTGQPYIFIDVNNLTTVGPHPSGRGVQRVGNNADARVNFDFSLQDAAAAGAPSPTSGLVRFDNFNWIQRIMTFYNEKNIQDKKGYAKFVQSLPYVQQELEGKITDSEGLSALSRPFDMTNGPILDPIPAKQFQTLLHGPYSPLFNYRPTPESRWLPSSGQPDEFEPYWDQVNPNHPLYWSHYDLGIHFEDTVNLFVRGRKLFFETTLGGWNEDTKTFVEFTDPQYSIKWAWLQTASGNECQVYADCGVANVTAQGIYNGTPLGEARVVGTGHWTPEEIESTAAELHAYFLTLPPEEPPTPTCVANAGSDRTVRLGSLVTLDGNASTDSDQGTSLLSYTWRTVSGPVAISLESTTTPSFLPPLNGVYVFGLTVNDGQDCSPEATVTITVPPLGDLNSDGFIDQNDLNILLAARNTPANGPNDLRDLDGDGTITALDARKLTLLCTQPRCAVIQ